MVEMAMVEMAAISEGFFKDFLKNRRMLGHMLQIDGLENRLEVSGCLESNL